MTKVLLAVLSVFVLATMFATAQAKPTPIAQCQSKLDKVGEIRAVMTNDNGFLSLDVPGRFDSRSPSSATVTLSGGGTLATPVVDGNYKADFDNTASSQPIPTGALPTITVKKNDTGQSVVCSSWQRF